MLNNEKLESAKLVLAHVLHELNPEVAVEKWAEHIEKNKNNPKAFFGSNGEGFNQYTGFISQHDKKKHELREKIKRGA